MLSVRDPIRRRQPVERPLDVVALELLVSITQALLVGILLSLATQLGGDARAAGLPIPGLLAILGIAVGAGWVRWLMGGSGWIMASVCLATSILAGALWLLSLQDQTLPRIDPLVGLIAVACAIYGLTAGVFLDGPHRAHWKGGISQPRRGVPQTRATPARFSPPVQKVVDERLTDLHLPKVTLPAAPKVTLPSIRRSTASDGSEAPPVGDGLAIAAQVVPTAPASAGASSAASAPAAAVPESAPGRGQPTPAAAVTATDDAAAPESEPPAAADVATSGEVAAGAAAAAGAEAAAVPPSDAPTEALTPAARATGAEAPAAAAPAASDDTEASEADPDAPTEPVARPAPQWPRPIEPRGHTGAHPVDPGS